jgi:acetoin utilization deacetylase AcuC-like enzyme
MPLYYSQKFTIDLPKHRFPMERYKAVYHSWIAFQNKQINSSSSSSSSSSTGGRVGAKVTVPPQASLDDVLRVHDPDFVYAYAEGRLDDKANQTIGFPWSAEFVERTLCITGATVAAMEDVVSELTTIRDDAAALLAPFTFTTTPSLALKNIIQLLTVVVCAVASPN